MKKLIPILTLVIGVGIGWGIASYQSHSALQKIQQTWSPEFQKFITQSVQNGLILEKTMTKEDILDVASLGGKLVTDWKSQAYGQAFQSLLIKKLLEDGKVDDAIASSESCLKRFVEQYDRGDFKDDINEEMAGKLTEAIKTAKHRLEPTADANAHP